MGKWTLRYEGVGAWVPLRSANRGRNRKSTSCARGGSQSMRTDGYVVSLLAALAPARSVLVAAASVGVAVVLVVRNRLVLLLVLRHAAVPPERPEPELALHQRRVAVQCCDCDTIRCLAVSIFRQKLGLGFGWSGSSRKVQQAKLFLRDNCRRGY